MGEPNFWRELKVPLSSLQFSRPAEHFITRREPERRWQRFFFRVRLGRCRWQKVPTVLLKGARGAVVARVICKDATRSRISRGRGFESRRVHGRLSRANAFAFAGPRKAACFALSFEKRKAGLGKRKPVCARIKRASPVGNGVKTVSGNGKAAQVAFSQFRTNLRPVPGGEVRNQARIS